MYEQSFTVDQLVERFPAIGNLTIGMGYFGTSSPSSPDGTNTPEEDSIRYEVFSVLSFKLAESLEDQFAIENKRVWGEFDYALDYGAYDVIVDGATVSVLSTLANNGFKPHFESEFGGIFNPASIYIESNSEAGVNQVYDTLQRILDGTNADELIKTAVARQAHHGILGEPIASTALA